MFWVDKFEAAIDPSHFDGNIVWNQNKQSMMHVMKARWDPYGRFSARGAEALHAASRLSFEHSTCKVVVKWQDSGTRHRLIDLIRCHWPIFLIWTASGTHTINFGKPLIPLFVAGAVFGEPLVPVFVVGAVFGKPSNAFLVAGAVFGEPLVPLLVVGAVFGKPLIPFFVAGAVFGEPLVPVFVAGAVFGKPLIALFVAGAVFGEPLVRVFVAGVGQTPKS